MINASDSCLLFLSLLVATMHIIAVLTLSLLKDKSNQIRIMMGLSFAEMMFCVSYAVSIISRVSHLSIWMYHLTFVCVLLCNLAIKLSMICLLFDKLLNIYLNIKYPLIITKKRSIYAIGVVSSICVLYGLSLDVLVISGCATFSQIFKIDNYITLVLDATFTVVAIFMYIYLYTTVKKIRKKDRSQGPQGNPGFSHVSIVSKFIFPLLTTTTYLMFNVTSTMLFEIVSAHNHPCAVCPLLKTCAYFMAVTGFLTDAVLCIFMQRKFRSFWQMLSYKCRLNRIVHKQVFPEAETKPASVNCVAIN